VKVIVPVRYPLTRNSRRTLERALEMRDENDAKVVVLHVNLIQERKKASRSELRDEVLSEYPELNDASFVVRRGFLIEESIVDEVASQDADAVVIGSTRAGVLRRTFRRLIGNEPNIERFLRQNLDVTTIVVR